MTKQEEIAEGLRKIVFGKMVELNKKGVTGGIARDILRYLHSQGVVIKVEKKETVLIPFGGLDFQVETTLPISVKNLANAGYEAVAPLIEVKK